MRRFLSILIGLLLSVVPALAQQSPYTLHSLTCPAVMPVTQSCYDTNDFTLMYGTGTGTITFSGVAGVDKQDIVVTNYGAKGDGVSDDTPFIQAALNAGVGKRVVFPQGTYIVTSTVPANAILTLAGKTHIAGRGKAIIKVKNSTGNFNAIIGAGNDGLTEISGTIIEGMEIDSNIAGNPILVTDVTGGVLNFHRFAFFAAKTSELTITNNIFRNESNTNSIVTGEHNISNYIEISGNKWINGGNNPNNIIHDNSTIYLRGRNIIVRDNIFTAVSLDSPAAGAAIEMHASRYIISGNIIRNYLQGMNITGITEGESRDQIVTDNHITVRQAGIRIFSRIFGGHTTGYGMENVLVAHNQIKIFQVGYTGSGFNEAIALRPITLAARNIAIWNNHIEYEIELSATTYTGLSGAIGLNTTASTLLIEETSIKGNTIINAPQIAIVAGLGGGNFFNLDIVDNIISNPGQSLSPSTLPSFKTGIYFAPNQAFQRVNISRNTISDTTSTTRMVNGIFFDSILSSTSANVYLKDNRFLLTGSNKAAFLNLYFLVSANVIPEIDDNGNVPFIIPSNSFQAGSMYVDTTLDKRHTLQSTGTAWAIDIFSFNETTLPSTSPVDKVQLNGADRNDSVPGTTGLHVRAETGTQHYFGDRVGLGTINPATFAEVAGTLNVSMGEIQSAGVRVGYNLSVYAAGTAYALTNTAALLNFGTTDPVLVINQPGTYMLFARAALRYNAATYAANQTVTLKIRRTNNTPADIANSTITAQTRIITTITDHHAVMEFPMIIYTTALTTDSLELQGSVGTVPSAGSHDVYEASLIAVRLF